MKLGTWGAEKLGAVKLGTCGAVKLGAVKLGTCGAVKLGACGAVKLGTESEGTSMFGMLIEGAVGGFADGRPGAVYECDGN